VDALTKVHDHIIDQLRNKNKVFGIFLDLKKAFDTLDTNILIEKLKVYGISGPYNNLIKSYLTNRQNTAKIGNIYSKFTYIKYGVPQGSVLGPLLFNIYINDIKYLARNFEINLFADDTSLFCSASNYSKLVEKCNTALNVCHNWLHSNKLTLNISKSHFLDFSKSKLNRPTIELKIGSEPLLEVEYTKYLGLQIQNNLKWDRHIVAVINKLNSQIPLFYKIRDILPTHKKVNVYKALSLPHIIYGIELYGKYNSKWLKLLQKSQNRLLKILLRQHKLTNTNNLHKSNNILKICDIAKLRNYLVSHKVLYFNEQTNIAHEIMLTTSQITRQLRNNLDFRTTALHYSYQNKVAENASVHWNELPQNLKSIKCRNKFKENVQKFIIESYT